MANIEIGGRLHSTATGNVVTGANEVLDDTKNKKQSVINAEVDETIGDDNTAGTIKGRIKTLETAVGNGDPVDTRIANAVSTEAARAQEAEELLDEKLKLLNGSEVIVVEDHTQVASPDTQKIYREYGSNSYTDWMCTDVTTSPATWQAIATYSYPGVDNKPTPNSDKMAKSGGIDSREGSTESLVDKYVFKKTFANGEEIVSSTKYFVDFRQGDIYHLKLSAGSSLDSIPFYLVARGSLTPIYKTSITKNGVYLNIDMDAVGFSLYSNGTSGDRLVEIEISNVSYLYAQQKNIKHTIANTSRVLFNGIFEYKDIGASQTKTALSIPAGTNIDIFVNSNSEAEGPLYFYLLDSNSQTIDARQVSLGSSINITLATDVAYIQWYINGANVVHVGTFDISISANDTKQANENKILDKLTNQIYRREILYQDGKGGSRAGNRQSLSILKGEPVRIMMFRRTNQTGSIQLYLEDASNNIVLSKAFNVAGTDEIYVATDDIAYVSYYYADSAGSITKPGIVDLAISAIETEETYEDNIIYGPVKEKRVKGNTAYLREEILNTDAKEGDTFFIGFDNVIGTIYYGSAVTVRFLDSSNNILVSDNINYSEIEVAPENTAKIIVYLYPNQTSTAYNIDVTYKNLYIARGVDAKFNINGTLSSVSQPKSYYFTDNYINDKVARINELMESNYHHGDAFFFITDLHWSRYNQRQSPSLIQYIMDRTHVTKLIGGGDYEDQGADSNHNLLFNLLTNNYRRNDLNIVVGNHEYLQGTGNGIISSLYHGLSRYEPNYIGKLEKWYYYYDDNFRGIRWIFLASYDEGNPAASDGYSEEQKEWLENVALSNVPSGYDIVCVAHGGCGINQGPGNNNEFVWSNEKPIADIFDEYKESNPNTHILNIRGHVHRDRVVYTEGGLTYILTTCDKNVAWPSAADRENPESPYYQWYPDLDVDRTSGTIHEQAFDVMILNTQTHTLTAVRIGGKARDGVGNVPGNEVEERVVNY